MSKGACSKTKDSRSPEAALGTPASAEDHDTDKPPCSIRAALSHAVAEAVVLVIDAKREHDRAKFRQQNLDRSLMVLNMAKRNEKRAVEELEKHRKDHGC